MNFGFENPAALLAGCVTILLVLLGRRFLRDVLALDIPLGPPGGVPFKPQTSGAFLLRILLILELLGTLSLFTAAAGPIFVTSQLVWLNRGADIIFVLDISPSMAGIDMDIPAEKAEARNARRSREMEDRLASERMSRFDAARLLIKDFGDMRPPDALGLVAVGKDAALMIPPTIDRRLFYERLEALQLGELGDGTALGMGLAIAAFHIRHSAAPRKAVALITDGENNAGSIHPETSAAAVAEAGAALWVIGVGSYGEIPIDYVDPILKVHRTGTFSSRFNLEFLDSIARAGSGQRLSASTGRAFVEAFRRIHTQEMTVSRSGTVTKNRHAAFPFIVLGILLLFIPDMIRKRFLGARL